MTHNVVQIPDINNPDYILNAAKDQLESVIVIGREKNKELWVSSSEEELGDLLLLVEQAKMFLLTEAATRWK